MRRILLCVAALLLWAGAARSDDYWQQRTHYTIDAEFMPDSDLIVGTTHLRYWNQSPVTLTEVYFNLYNNAWRPGSYLDRRGRQMGRGGIAEIDSSDWGAMDVQSTVIAGQTVEMDPAEMDSTVMRVPLPQALAPGDSVDFDMKFRCKIPGPEWRNGAKGNHFDIAQWYPRICVFDRKGWSIEPQLRTGEFYADFGDYDVTFKAPAKYIIAHTGTLVNEEELFPGLPQGSPDTVLTDILADLKPAQDSTDTTAEADSTNTEVKDAPKDDSTRTWVMHAERVIDFAMGADPGFIWDRTRTKDGALIDCYYTKRSKKDWAKNGAAFTKYVIELYSDKFGQYPYPHYSLVASNFRGGVEYPQLTFVNGRASHIPSHSLFDVTAHEVAHCWFYGILATNEVEEAFLDEGFTSFATSVAIESYFGRWNNDRTFKTHADSVYSDADDERSYMQRRYIGMRSRMDNEPPLSTPSNDWPGFWTYGTMVYEKTATVLYELMDVLGEDTFWKCMQHYYAKWSFKHPQREDMYQSFDECSGENLTWFWEQWFEEGWTLDLSLDHVAFQNTDSGHVADVTVSRHGEGFAPVTVRFDYEDGTHVDRRLGLAPWRGRLLSNTYRVKLPSTGAGIDRVELDPGLYTPDLDRTNNFAGMMPFQFKFMPPKILYPNRHLSPPLDRQRVTHQPRLWYNEHDGVELGYFLENSWLDLGHRWDGLVMVGTESGEVDWWIQHKEIWERISRKAQWGIEQRRRDGRWDAQLDATFSLSQYYWRPHDISLAYRIGAANDNVEQYLYPQVAWEHGTWSEAELRYRQSLDWEHDSHKLTAKVQTSAVGSDFAYQHGELEVASEWTFPNVPEFESRLYVSMLGGSPPVQMRPTLATGSGMDYFDDAYYRSVGTLPTRGLNDGRIFLPGGGHLVGYMTEGNAAPDNMVTMSLLHQTALIQTLVPRDIPLVSRNVRAVQAGVFADGGTVWNNTQALNDTKWLADAGVLLTYSVPYQWFARIFGDQPIRAYFPLWVSDPLTGDPLDFRWQLSFTGSW